PSIREPGDQESRAGQPDDGDEENAGLSRDVDREHTNSRFTEDGRQEQNPADRIEDDQKCANRVVSNRPLDGGRPRRSSLIHHSCLSPWPRGTTTMLPRTPRTAFPTSTYGNVPALVNVKVKLWFRP